MFGLPAPPPLRGNGLSLVVLESRGLLRVTVVSESLGQCVRERVTFLRVIYIREVSH